MEALDELIARLETATEGSAELDGRVLCAVRGWRFISAEDRGALGLVVRCAPQSYEGDVGFTTNKPTRSLDAALTLLPGGYTRAVDATVPEAGIDVDIYSPAPAAPNASLDALKVRFIEKEFRGTHTSEPIATCIAALKARAAS